MLPAFDIAAPLSGQVGIPLKLSGFARNVGNLRRVYAVLATESLTIHVMAEFYKSPFAFKPVPPEESVEKIMVETTFIPPLPGTYSIQGDVDKIVVK